MQQGQRQPPPTGQAVAETHRIDLRLVLLPTERRRSRQQPRGQVANLVARARLVHVADAARPSRCTAVSLERSQHLLTERQQRQILALVHQTMSRHCQQQGRTLAPLAADLKLTHTAPSGPRSPQES